MGLTEYANEMRDNPTSLERLFARRLSKAKIHYLQQYVIGFYIVDFFLPEKMTIVEVDGPYHGQKRQQKRDANRAAWLSNLGFRIIRIPANQVEFYQIERLIDLKDRPLKECERALGLAVKRSAKVVQRETQRLDRMADLRACEESVAKLRPRLIKTAKKAS